MIRSLRTRIALVVIGCALVVASTISLIVDRQFMISGREHLRETAIDQLDAATATYEFSGALSRNATTNQSVMPPTLRSSITGDLTATYFDGATMWGAHRVADSKILAVRVSADQLTTQRSQLRAILTWTSAAVVVLAGAVGFLVANQLTRRLRRAASMVVGADSTQASISDAVGGNDEVAELATTIDELTTRLSDRLDRERAFSANVAHELRNPLTALVNATELLDDADEATALVRNQTKRIRALVENLLDLARSEGGADRDRFDAHESATLVRSIVRDIERLTEARAQVVAEFSARVLTDPHRLGQVLSNLIVNGNRHGGGNVRVVVLGDTVEVRDAGPGFPDDIVRNGPHRFSTYGRAGGSGLGLVLATQLCEALGGNLVLTNGPLGGAVARFTLPLAPPEAPSHPA
ncbi:sensor histidine kinase [Rarobacter incanus]|uniref:histidine kinase n=1 Tax=Rarobacter incanus TaxID=153494 RepID=A0A542SQL9_9MICO|nr:HAMP domain-containing sensor histidine kinase [Rarobacter incanus]TQK76913.1 signal transduction histidine kinase [Rarobacter incanus]